MHTDRKTQKLLSILNRSNISSKISEKIYHNINILTKSCAEADTISNIKKMLELTTIEYENQIVKPLLENLLAVLDEKVSAGDCPIIRKVILIFFIKGLKVEDIFLNCTTFKNTINNFLIENSTKQEREEILFILDINLHSILSIFSQKVFEQEKNILSRMDAINEYSVLSITDINGVIKYVSDSYANLTGYSKFELLNKSFKILRDPNVPNEFYEELWSTIKNGKTWSGKIMNLDKHSNSFYIHTEIKPIYDHEGSLSEYIAFKKS